MTDNMLDIALEFAKLRIPVFPLAQGSKQPRPGSRGLNDATTDEATLRKWWAENPRYNVGVVPGPLPNGMYIFILDLDVKHGKDGIAFFQKWCADNAVDYEKLIRSTLTVRTGSGGLQTYMVSDAPVRNSVDVFGKGSGVDTRSNRKGYGIAPGSVVDGKAYTVEHDADNFLIAPPALVEKIGIDAPAPERKPIKQTPIGEWDQPEHIKWAVHFLNIDAMAAIEGRGGDQTTLKVAAALKDHGISREKAKDLMLAHYNRRCVPAWSNEDLNRKVDNAFDYCDKVQPGASTPIADFAGSANQAGSEPTQPEQSDLGEDADHTGYEYKKDRTDLGNANLLVKLTKAKLRFVHEKNFWLTWIGGRWQEATGKVVVQQWAEMVPKWYQVLGDDYTAQIEKASTKDERKKLTDLAESAYKWEKTCREKKRIDSLLSVASQRKAISLSVAQLDCDPWLLGVLNGVVELRTGTLRAAAMEDFVTIHCPVRFNPEAKAPIWERTLAEVTGIQGPTPNEYTPRPDLLDFLQRVLGYALTGLVREQKMFFWNGPGSNGKSLVADIIRRVMGKYSGSIPSALLMQSKYVADGERPTPHAAQLFRKRFVMTSETKAGHKLDTDFVKSQTGETWQKARSMRENPFEFENTHKLFLMTNAMPEIDHLDEAIQSRLIVFPFDRIWNRPGHPNPNPASPNADETLSDRLKGEAEGILAWMVRGAVNYASQGLRNPPEAVKVKTAGYPRGAGRPRGLDCGVM